MPTNFDTWLQHVLTSGPSDEDLCWEPSFHGYIKQFNARSADLTERFGYSQIRDAIIYIFSSDSGYMIDALAPDTGPLRLELIASMRDLYQNCFDVYCDPLLGHLQRSEDERCPLNDACYMLWDMYGVERPAQEQGGEILHATIELLDWTLRLSNVACQESALHGLGHLAEVHAELVRQTIEPHVQSSTLAWPLESYARDAMEGRIL